MLAFWKSAAGLERRVLIPKFYDPQLQGARDRIGKTRKLVRFGDLVESGVVSVSTGDEIGKSAYGTGEIPFVRTSDISNWEIKSAPKQGVSTDIYEEFSKKQDVKTGDILLVRDGTYLIGTNCFVTDLDREIIYQSHILKFRVNETSVVDPHILFLCLNTPFVKRQFRSLQFTADTIDTIGHRYLDVILPLPLSADEAAKMVEKVRPALTARVAGKAFIKQAPFLLEEVLRTGSIEPLRRFVEADLAEIRNEMMQDTVTSEFGGFETFWRSASSIKSLIYLPKYYDPSIDSELEVLRHKCDCVAIGDLVDEGVLAISTGDEIGKMAYGTGSIPFLRTSDFANWEIKHDPKQGVSEEIYEEYRYSQDLRSEDILLVRDGTYLIGSSCIVTEGDHKAIFCGGLIKIRSNDHKKIDPYLLLALLNSYIVKRQIRTKQFTRDVIDTLGPRLREVVVPIPKCAQLRAEISAEVKGVVNNRMEARKCISSLALQLGGV